MKNSRLFQLLYLLMEKRDWTAEELAERTEVSKRTIYRDIDALSAAGIPVFSVKGQGGGIRLMDQFQLDRSLVSPEGQDQILTSLKSLEAVGLGEHGEILSQLSGLFQKEPVDWLEVDFESWGAVQGEKKFFELCREAILKRRLLTLKYCNSSGERAVRRVEPERLCFKGGNWYLSAYCLLRGDFRLFRLNRIEELVMEEETFLPGRHQGENDKGKALSWLEKEEERLCLELRFTETAAYQVMDSFAPQQIERLPDGGFLVKVSFPSGRWVLGFLLSFGAELEVLKPEAVREQLRQEAERIRGLYGGVR